MKMKFVLLLACIGLCSAALRDRAHQKYIGVAISHQHLAASALYQQIAGTEFNSVTAEWQMKQDPIWNDRYNPNWVWAEEIMTFAQHHGQSVRGHAFVWHEAYPSWMDALESNPAELQEVLNQQTRDTATHFRGRCKHWDVVNEAFEDNGQFRNSLFYRALGSNYINQAFITARQYDPTTILYYNDYNIEGINAKSNATYNLIQNLRSQGVPIDAVGLQGHFIVGQVPSDLVANMQRFANLGIDVAITELDVRITLPATQANLEQQARDYATVIQACAVVSRCVGVTIWGVTDYYSWVPSTFPGEGDALIFDHDYNRKLAYYSVENYLQ